MVPLNDAQQAKAVVFFLKLWRYRKFLHCDRFNKNIVDVNNVRNIVSGTEII